MNNSSLDGCLKFTVYGSELIVEEKPPPYIREILPGEWKPDRERPGNFSAFQCSGKI